jgi:hypothetical protein
MNQQLRACVLALNPAIYLAAPCVLHAQDNPLAK